jgi:hypothetical protein
MQAVAVPPDTHPQRVPFYAMLGVQDPHIAPFVAYVANLYRSAATRAMAEGIMAMMSPGARESIAGPALGDAGPMEAPSAAAAAAGEAAQAAAPVTENPDEIPLDF